MGWNAAFFAVATVGILGRWFTLPATTIPNAMLSGELGVCIGAVSAMLLGSWLHPGQKWLYGESLAWLPIILLGATLAPFVLFLLGCVVVSALQQGSDRH